MKEKLINLENGQSVCVLDELNYNEKKYILTVECNTVTNEILNRYKIYELALTDNSLTLNTINNKDVLSSVTKMFLDNIKNI